MDLDALQKKLLAAARRLPPDDNVPYAFEKRIMARLTAVAPVDGWTIWGGALWRAAVSCVVIMLAVSLWTLWSAQGKSVRPDFAQQFETALFAMPERLSDVQ